MPLRSYLITDNIFLKIIEKLTFSMVNLSTFDRTNIYHIIMKQVCAFPIPREQHKSQDFFNKTKSTTMLQYVVITQACIKGV